MNEAYCCDAVRRVATLHEAWLDGYPADWTVPVETWRQTVPRNAAAITALLLEAGADPRATMTVYGGDHDTLSLLLSSAHPAAASVTSSVASVLRVAAA